MPRDVICPFDEDGVHSVPDAYSELFEDPAKLEISKGLAAMRCPVCDKPWKFPRGWFSNPVSGEGLPIFYWSQRKWDGYDETRKDEIRQRIPDVEQYLR
jgi:hypothetical protein